MTPDMQRLCEAAEQGFIRATGRAPELTDAEAQSIVRAILTALREPSEATIERGGYALNLCERPQGDDDGALRALTAMIDHILAERRHA